MDPHHHHQNHHNDHHHRGNTDFTDYQPARRGVAKIPAHCLLRGTDPYCPLLWSLDVEIISTIFGEIVDHLLITSQRWNGQYCLHENGSKIFRGLLVHIHEIGLLTSTNMLSQINALKMIPYIHQYVFVENVWDGSTLRSKLEVDSLPCVVHVRVPRKSRNLRVPGIFRNLRVPQIQIIDSFLHMYRFCHHN